MRNSWHNRPAPAFTLVEMLVVIAIIAVLAALLLPALTKGKSRAQRVECIADLNQLGTAFQMFAHDHQGKFPMQVAVADGGSMEYVQAGESISGVFYFSYRHFQALASDLIVPKTLVCPTDLGREPAMNFGVLQNSNISYFVGVNADYNIPMSILAGDRNITNYTGATASLVRGAYGLRWTSEMHVFKGNVLFADAHVEQVNNDNLDFSGSPLASSTFFLPAVNGGGPTGPPASPPTFAASPPESPSGPGQSPTPGAASPGNSGSAASAPSTPSSASQMNIMPGSSMANHGTSDDAMTTVDARHKNAAATPRTAPAAAPRGPDDEPEPPLLMLAGVAKTVVAKSSWWWWLLLFFLIALSLYLYARRKLREWARVQERRAGGDDSED